MSKLDWNKSTKSFPAVYAKQQKQASYNVHQEISSWQSYIAQSATFKSTWKPDDSHLFYPDYTSWATTLFNGLFNESVLEYKLIPRIKCLSSPISYNCLLKSMTEWSLWSRSHLLDQLHLPLAFVATQEKHEAHRHQTASLREKWWEMQASPSSNHLKHVASGWNSSFNKDWIFPLNHSSKAISYWKADFKAHPTTAFLYSCNAI